MRIWCYDDAPKWGPRLRAAALARGHDARLFSDPALPDEGMVFARIHHNPKVRGRDKQVMAYLAPRRELTLVPNYRACVLYDDKAEQARTLARWMPRTAIVYSRGAAERMLDYVGLPLMSKTSEGAGSFNVRLIRTREQALREIELAFGAGIPCHFGQVQKGYLLWQQFLPGNDYDFRVIAAGSERLILRRGNRDDRPMASGSNKEMPIRWPDREASSVLDFANEFFAEERFPWCGIDVVKDHAVGEWRLLEMTTGWPLGKNHIHRTVGGRAWADFFDIIVEQMERGHLQ